MVSVANQHQLVLVVGWMSLFMVGTVAGFCPYGCGCDETNSRVTCIRSDLEVRSFGNMSKNLYGTDPGNLSGTQILYGTPSRRLSGTHKRFFLEHNPRVFLERKVNSLWNSYRDSLWNTQCMHRFILKLISNILSGTHSMSLS